MNYFAWLGRVKALFPITEEFALACASYSFQAAYDRDLTPQQAYDDFDAVKSCEAEVA